MSLAPIRAMGSNNSLAGIHSRRLTVLAAAPGIVYTVWPTGKLRAPVFFCSGGCSMAITVTLDDAGTVQLQPPTEIKKRNGKTKHTVTWKRGKGQDFVLIGVNIDAPDGVFETPKIKDKTITVVDNIKKGSATVDYTYTLFVRTPDGKVHSSDGPSPELESGRGVIRNEA
jgi:hypothetical protein